MTQEHGPGVPDDPHSTEPRGRPPHEQGPTDLSPGEEPRTTGTLFIMVLFLMALAGMWAIMYFTLLSR